ncbi:hypothetical protein DID78_01190 [Candidatus Marinamargulisbacteria bacterium SCGC AG-343-D04]|nr:hypothetical protein DID78_01190 [Candidatus Marinamargulisbacteria bacterium SCGC AG-343-D04]
MTKNIKKNPKEIKSFSEMEKIFRTNIQEETTQNITLKNEDWLIKFNQILSKNNIKTILLFGSCLGVIRQNSLIDYDHDADIGIFFEDLLSFHNCLPELEKEGFYISKTKKFKIHINMPNTDFCIDLMPVKKIQNIFFKLFGYKWFCDMIYFKDNFFESPKKINFKSQVFFTPNPTELYLEKTYGKNWRTPIKNRNAHLRPVLSQIIIKYFVDFPVPLEFSGDNSLGTFKPWISKLLIKTCPNAKITSSYKHPKSQ